MHFTIKRGGKIRKVRSGSTNRQLEKNLQTASKFRSQTESFLLSSRALNRDYSISLTVLPVTASRPFPNVRHTTRFTKTQIVANRLSKVSCSVRVNVMGRANKIRILIDSASHACELELFNVKIVLFCSRATTKEKKLHRKIDNPPSPR